MAIAKVILNGETLMDVTSDTVSSSSLLSSVTATKNDGTKVTGNIATATHPNPTASINSSTGVVTASHTQGTGYVTGGTTTGTLTLSTQAAKTVTPTEAVQRAVSAGYYTTGNVSVAAISSTYVGTGVTTRSSANLTASGSTVTAPAGYYSTAASKSISAGSAFPPAVTITKNPTFSMNSATGVVTASYNGSSSITPTVTAGYISQGTAGTISTSGTSTYQLTTQAAQTIYTSTADQTIASNRWLTGAQTIKSVTTTNLTAENIAEGVVVKVGDANNASRITQITGTHSGGGGGGITADEIAMRTISGAISGSATSIYSYAFSYCYSLTEASFPSCLSIGGWAFYACSELSTVSFPACTSIGSSAFLYCSSLTEASFPACTYLGMYAFSGCSKLTTANFPVLPSIGASAFNSCTALTTISFPKVSSVEANAFRGCFSLATASFPSATYIGASAFYLCYNLLSLYLLGSSVASLGNKTAFTTTPISNYTTSTGGVYGSIFVPASLYDSYITATNWSVYSARIVSV